MEKCLTVDIPEAARLLGVSTVTGYRMAQRGEMPGLVRLGRTLRVSRKALEEFLNGQKVAGAVNDR